MSIYKYIFTYKKDVLDINFTQHTFFNIYPIDGYQRLWVLLYITYIIPPYIVGYMLYFSITPNIIN